MISNTMGLVKPVIPYSGSKIKELNKRQNYNRLHKKNKLLKKNLIDNEITPINQTISNKKPEINTTDV